MSDAHDDHKNAGFRTWLQRRIRPKTAMIEQHETAQEVYKRLLNELLSPAFRERGFTGSAGRYSLSSKTHWVLLGFQKSAYSDRDSIKFTINLMVVPRSDWEDFRAQSPTSPARPTPNAHYSTDIGAVRIGTLDQVNGRDKWWTLQAGSDLEAIATDLLHDVDQWALPWMQAQITGQ